MGGVLTVINFPASPTTGDTYTFGTRTWTFDGSGWVRNE